MATPSVLRGTTPTPRAYCVLSYTLRDDASGIKYEGRVVLGEIHLSLADDDETKIMIKRNIIHFNLVRGAKWLLYMEWDPYEVKGCFVHPVEDSPMRVIDIQDNLQMPAWNANNASFRLVHHEIYTYKAPSCPSW